MGMIADDGDKTTCVPRGRIVDAGLPLILLSSLPSLCPLHLFTCPHHHPFRAPHLYTGTPLPVESPMNYKK